MFTNATDPYGITNGSNGLANVDPLAFFGGHLTIHTTQGLLLVPPRGRHGRPDRALHFLSESRTGRAWKASREDPLAAELMGVPVNRLKIMAFSFGAGIAGLAGSIFAAVQTGAFPENFGTAVLILIYAVVILGGTGSLTGMVVGAIVIIASNQVLDSTSPPNLARVLFYAALIAAVLLTMKTWQKSSPPSPEQPPRPHRRTRSSAPSGRPAPWRGHVGRVPGRDDQALGADPRTYAPARRVRLRRC